MCLHGSGSVSGPNTVFAIRTDPTTGAQSLVNVEQGIPQDYINRGASTIATYQTMASQDLSDKQIAAQQKIADQQQAFNQQQFDYQKQQAQQQQDQANQQAARQSEYEQGRAGLLDQGAKQVNDAFAQFTPDYFNQYAKDYMTQAQDDIGRQQQTAQKNLALQAAAQGLSDSQANVNQQGLIQETAGRATAEQTQNAQNAEAQLQTNVAGAKQGLLGQVQASESIGSPIAGSTEQDVQSGLNTQRSAISGITANSGDIVSSLNAVPTVSTLGNIFSGILGTAGSAFSGLTTNQALTAFKTAAGGGGAAGPVGTNPSG